MQKEKDVGKKTHGIGKIVIMLWSLSIFGAIASYLFFFVMARMLGQENYGLFYSLIAILYIFSVPVETIRFVISKYTAIYYIKKQYGKIKNLIIRSFKRIFFYSMILFAVFVLITPIWLSNFLHTGNLQIIITLLAVPFMLVAPIFQGALQGMKRFLILGVNGSLEYIIKLILAVSLVALGLGIYGALISIPIATMIAMGLILISLSDILKKREERVDSSSIYNQFISFFFVILFLTVMSSIDVIIAKHFFSASYAGFYAAISTLGTSLFFLSVSVTKVMFPLVTEHNHKGEENKHLDVLYKSLFLVVIPSSVLILAFIIFPKFIVMVFFGSKYLAISDFIKYEAIAMSFLALSNVLALYNLAINRKIVYLPAIFCALEIVLLTLFHESLMTYLRMLMLANILLFIFLLVSTVDFKHFFGRTKEIIKIKQIKKDSKDIKTKKIKRIE